MIDRLTEVLMVMVLILGIIFVGGLILSLIGLIIFTVLDWFKKGE